MSEWDDFGETSPSVGKTISGKGKKNDYAGKLNILMTTACFCTVTAVSFLVAWLMKDTARNFWEMGLTFAAPFAALMGSAMLIERSTSRMTPQCSRNAQRICILMTIATAFFVGSLAEALHQPVVIENHEPEYDYMIVLDKSGSMVFESLDNPGRQALHELIDNMEDCNQVGIVAFGSKVVGEQDVLPLDDEQRKKLHEIIDIPIEIWEEKNPLTGKMEPFGDGTNFTNAMNGAMNLIKNMPERTRTMRIILVTDGDNQSVGSFAKFNKWASERNEQNEEQERIELCAIQIGTVPMLNMVKEAVNKTGGTIYDNVSTEELAQQLQSLKKTIVTKQPVDTLKATYEGRTADGDPNTPYMILSCILMILQGVLCGFALKIMFSVQGQFRFQTILSPLMGLAAFLLLNFGRYIGIAPAWACEGLAFSLFGLVFMRENLNAGKNSPSGKTSGGKKNAPAGTAEAYGGDDW